jgi:hypothetical protein
MIEQLEELLHRVPQKSDEDFARARVIGRAVSRSDTHLHLATRRGVVAIPLSQIDDVRGRFADDPARVTVTVRERESVQLVRPAQVDIDPGPVVILGPGVSMTVCTTTYTGEGEEETTCDDEDCRGPTDDDEPS